MRTAPLPILAALVLAAAGCSNRGADDRVSVEEAARSANHGPGYTVVALRHSDRARLSNGAVIVNSSGEEPVYIMDSGYLRPAPAEVISNRRETQELVERVDALLAATSAAAAASAAREAGEVPAPAAPAPPAAVPPARLPEPELQPAPVVVPSPADPSTPSPAAPAGAAQPPEAPAVPVAPAGPVGVPDRAWRQEAHPAALDPRSGRVAP